MDESGQFMIWPLYSRVKNPRFMRLGRIRAGLDMAVAKRNVNP
jgi:hypothetical protein